MVAPICLGVQETTGGDRAASGLACRGCAWNGCSCIASCPCGGTGLVWPAVHNFKRKQNPHLWILSYLFTLKQLMFEPKKAHLKADLALKPPFCDLWHLQICNSVCVHFHFSVFILHTFSSIKYPRGSRKHVEGTQLRSADQWRLINEQTPVELFWKETMNQLVSPTFSALCGFSSGKQDEP